MGFSPVLFVHICSGICGLFSGAAAVALRKGSRRHALAGNIFVVSMMSLAATGVYLALLKGQPGNVLGGSFHLLSGSHRLDDGAPPKPADRHIRLARPAHRSLGRDRVHHLRHSKPPPVPTACIAANPCWPVLLPGFGCVVALAGDIRMLVRGGIDGTQRLARHLWRMCFALFVASGSIFLARQHLFPAVMRTTGALYLLTFLPLLLMIFWLIRVRLATAYKRLFVHAQA